MRVIISGGGTGGHIFPAIAIADALISMQPKTEVLFIGAEGKMEMNLVPQAGYKIKGLPIRGFQRKITINNLSFPFKLILSLWKAYQVLKEFKPEMVIGLGGYASGPTLKVANWLNIPTMIQEQNSYAGATNRLLGNKAKKIFVAYDQMDKFFKKENLMFTGNPIRKTLKSSDLDQRSSVLALGLNPNLKTIFIFGGSLGAKTLNEAVVKGWPILDNPDGVNLIWQIGKLNWEKYGKMSPVGLKNVKAFSFIEDMAVVYNAADLVVCRAGALAISEIALLGKPTILVPSPNVAEDHQTSNAMALVNKKAAVLIKDSEADEKLVSVMLDLVQNDSMLEKLSKNIGFFAKPDAAIKIAEEILKYGSSNKGN
ncbi:MAG: undecaprenyldiphospho-muramoylpentapeptide beta-N-acetylglucosaminyltransferase [Saprospiraceae bacterium]